MWCKCATQLCTGTLGGQVIHSWVGPLHQSGPDNSLISPCAWTGSAPTDCMDSRSKFIYASPTATPVSRPSHGADFQTCTSWHPPDSSESRYQRKALLGSAALWPFCSRHPHSTQFLVSHQRYQIQDSASKIWVQFSPRPPWLCPLTDWMLLRWRHPHPSSP